MLLFIKMLGHEEPKPSGLEAQLVKQLDFFTIDVHLQCPRGKTLILTGPSGSGKTTLLRCLAGLDSIDKGFITFDGKPWADTTTKAHLGTRHRHVGFLSQEYHLFPHMTVLENIRFGARDRTEAESYLGAMNITHLGSVTPRALSGGERQRVALCQTLASKPQLLLLDEPFSALDLENRILLRQWLAEQQQKHHFAIIQVTHDLTEALNEVANVMALEEGRTAPEWLNRQKYLFWQSLGTRRERSCA